MIVHYYRVQVIVVGSSNIELLLSGMTPGGNLL